MKVLRNNNGVTLIEVLAALTILSIILVSLMNIFPQMGKMNKYNEDKVQAISLAKELLIEWQENSEMITYISNPDTTLLLSLDPPQLADGYYVFNTTKNDFKATINIKEVASKISKLHNAHLIVVRLLNDNDKVVTETYGYILVPKAG
ncbi:type IV pilus modification PilV family protein [Mesobacillus maritimus]|uniref:Prepilin-type N-terminal cleavage/methylation domain-containing protein n=1 Tax=Mesobacillus maritimus TaxID=1643336 RepID=A0ABS7KA59_9BACI|nr:prepilin-type N-terminal cleavage/methylation domain-containing protein [Mesobacillus maritimus]MBY0099113.1 prepilin-type N-terminal cleavage/methylation domain-containing protein [Mesobacillus maritimus]